MIDTEVRAGQLLPKYILNGNAARFIYPVAKEVCLGKGLDIGCGKLEWSFPGSWGIDPKIDNLFDAYNLPFSYMHTPISEHNSLFGFWDYIFSSHCLEHLPDYMKALKYWTNFIRPGGILFLYLPHPDCLYWRPENKKNDPHLHRFEPKQMIEIFAALGYKNIYVSGCDLAFSFAIFGEKR